MNIGLLIGSCLTASLSPGPASLSTIETSLRYGKRRTFWHTLGLAVGETPHLFLALYGTHWLTVHVPYALSLIGFAGMSYFLYLGVGLLLRPRSSLPESVGVAGGALGKGKLAQALTSTDMPKRSSSCGRSSPSCRGRHKAAPG